jgi:ribosomal protein L40E
MRAKATSAENRCRRCGESTGSTAVVVNHASSDPLQVTECRRCGAILDIGGHRW